MLEKVKFCDFGYWLKAGVKVESEVSDDKRLMNSTPSCLFNNIYDSLFPRIK